MLEVKSIFNLTLVVECRLDKTRFHIIGAILFTAQSALLHPTAVVKTRMQVDGSGLSHMGGISVFRHILKSDGIPGLFRGFGTSAIGSLPGRVLALTSLEVSKDMMFKYTKHLDMPEATRVGIANGVAGLFSNLVSCVYYVPLDVVCRLFLSFDTTSFFFLSVLLGCLHTKIEKWFQKQEVFKKTEMDLDDKDASAKNCIADALYRLRLAHDEMVKTNSSTAVTDYICLIEKTFYKSLEKMKKQKSHQRKMSCVISNWFVCTGVKRPNFY